MNVVKKRLYCSNVLTGLALALVVAAAGEATAFAQAGGAGGAGGSGTAGAGGAGGAAVTPSCSNATLFPNPIIITGSSAFEPTASYFAAKAAAMTPPVTIMYNGTGSCVGVDAVRNHQALTKTANAYLS